MKKINDILLFLAPWVVALILCSVAGTKAMAVTNTATAGATWAAATWSQGHVPTSSEDVVINSGINLTIGTAAVCGSLTIGNATATATTLTIGAGGSQAQISASRRATNIEIAAAWGNCLRSPPPANCAKA